MTQNVKVINADEKVKEIQVAKFVPLTLKDDLKPELSGTLEAKGHDITDVNDLQSKTYNGIDLIRWVKEMYNDTITVCNELFSFKNHTHDAIERLPQIIKDTVIPLLPDPKSFAPAAHSHPTVITPLSQVESGQKLKDLLDKSFSEDGHTHADLRNALQSLQAALQTLQAQNAAPQSEDASSAKFDAIAAEIDALTVSIKKLQASTKPAEDSSIEMTAMQYCLIPHKCHGRKLVAVHAVDLNGKRGDITIKSQGAPITVGQVVAEDDILLSPPEYLVRYVFQ